ncbi:hypothetical protein GCM10010104_16640 [Streptomyces indiaensis]|uniref:Uncharacterized protein n=1 Tax=Streptomyces indiaensis TaxID=284033 RepID=A0ABN3DAD7_9ACTN
MTQLGQVCREQPVGDGLTVDEYTVIVEDHEVVAHGSSLNAENPASEDAGFSQELFGGVLLSHRVPPAVPSAL